MVARPTHSKLGETDMREYHMTLNFSTGAEAEARRYAYSAESAVKAFELETLQDRPAIGTLTSVVVVWTI